MSPQIASSGDTHGVGPERLGLILQDGGWHVVGRREGAYVRLAPPGTDHRSVVIPLDHEAPEFQEMMSAAVLSIQELVPQGSWVATISARLSTQPVDGFRFTKASSAPLGMIPWPSGEQLIEAARRALTAGAKASLERMSHYNNRLGQFANRYLDSVLMGQTASGSYVVTAFCPTTSSIPITSTVTQDPIFGEPDNAVPTRDIGLRVMTAIGATMEAAHHYRASGSLAAFSELVSEGVSYEMATALHALAADSDGAEVSATWDPSVAPPPSAPSERIELQPSDAEILRRGAAQLLDDVAAPEHLAITGRVHLLSRKEAGGPAVIGVENISSARPKKIRVHLSDDDYHRALSAHDEDRGVIVEGQVDREGNIFWMYSGRLVQVLGTLDEIRGFVDESTSGEVSGQTTIDDWNRSRDFGG